MKRIFTIILLATFVSTASAQLYSTGKRTITFTDNNRSSRQIPTDIYYPANTAGTNVALAAGTAKYPVVVFGHGFLIGTSSYKWLADSLVKRGYIVALPTTEDGIIPNHLDFAEDLAFLCGRLTSLNDSTTSFLYHRVIKKAAVGGHSMGGGASFLAAAGFRPSINALFNFAAAETTPPATLAAYLNFKPTLIFSGSADCIAKDSIQEVMYNNTLLACKTYINITDGLHCQFANNNLICFAGQLASGCGFSSVSTNTVLSKTISLLAPFLEYYLKDICTGGETFVNTYNNITGVTKRRSCLPYPACGPVPVKLTSFSGNIKNDKVNLYWNTASEFNVDHMIIERSNDGQSFNSLVKVSPKGNNGNGAAYTAIDAYPYAGVNFYRLKTVDLDGSMGYSEIIKITTVKKGLAVTQLYPNPVKDQLHIQLQSDRRQDVLAQVFDLTGKQLLQNNISLGSGMNETQLRLTGLASGTYFIRYTYGDGTSAGTFKIVKD